MTFVDVIRKGKKKLVASMLVADGNDPRQAQKALRQIYNPKKHRFEVVKRQA